MSKRKSKSIEVLRLVEEFKSTGSVRIIRQGTFSVVKAWSTTI
ncbi:hypothetical protein [Dyadobacter tibetensis]|nr:hypothetical protein [Dyadobacter tibetensis]